MPVPFVGRAAELARLRAAWRSATDGQGQLILLAAAPGTGRTALVQQFLAEALPPRVVWASGVASEQEVPWRVLDQLAEGLGTLTGTTPRWERGKGAGNPAFAGLPLVETLVKAKPVVLVLDDAHWADEQSRSALAFVARRLANWAGLMIVSFDDTPDAGDEWLRLFPAVPGDVIELAGLDPGELVPLATALGRVGLSAAGAARLHSHTGGNPRLVRDQLRSVTVADVNTGDGPLPAPHGVTAEVRKRLANCTEPARRVAVAAAVLGTDFEVAQADALAAVTDVAARLDELVAAGLVAQTPATAGRRLHFRDAFHRQAIYDLAGLATRRALHARAAALAAGPAALRHRVAAADGVDPDLATALDLQALADAQAGDMATAAGHWREALRRTPPGPERRARLLRLVEAALIAGDAAAALAHRDEIAAGGGDPWWDYVAGYQVMLDGQFEEARRRFLRALKAADDAGPEAPRDLRARIATQLAIIGLLSSSYQDMVTFGQIAITAADDRRTRAFAWFTRTVGLALAGHGEQALAELAASGLEDDIEPLVARGMVALWLDDLEPALRHLTTAVDRAYRGEPLRVPQAVAFLGEAEYRRGLLADSALHVEQAVAESRAHQRLWFLALKHGLACQTRAAQGEWAGAREHAQAAEKEAAAWAEIVGSSAGRLSAAASRALLAQAHGDAPGLLRACEDVEAYQFSREPGVTLLGPVRAEALVLNGDADSAEAALSDYVAGLGAAHRRSALMGIARVRGRIAAARGAHADALAAYTEALSLADGIGLPLEAGRIEMAMGECLAVSGRLAGAGLRLRASRRCFARIGAHAYAAQAAGQLARFGLPLGDPDDLLLGLTASLVPVARVLLGNPTLSNRQIALALRMTESGVEQRFTRLYDALFLTGSGSGKRAALVRLLHGPPPPNTGASE
jgi:tetratricopeptide (TPR) repeat protein